MGIEVTGLDELMDSIDELGVISEVLGEKPYTIEELEVMYGNAKGECAKALIDALIRKVKEQVELQQ